MNVEENDFGYWKYIKSKQDKFEYAFALLAFATLSLSVQFLSSFGQRASVLLVESWFVFLISAFCSGYRLMMSPQLDKIDRARVHLDTFVNQRKIQLQDPGFVSQVEINPPFDPATATRYSLDEMIDTLKKEEGNLKIAEENLASLDRKLSGIFDIQIASYLLGTVMTLVFVSINYLIK